MHLKETTGAVTRHNDAVYNNRNENEMNRINETQICRYLWASGAIGKLNEMLNKDDRDAGKLLICKLDTGASCFNKQKSRQIGRCRRHSGTVRTLYGSTPTKIKK
jgi:hypothetical protein